MKFNAIHLLLISSFIMHAQRPEEIESTISGIPTRKVKVTTVCALSVLQKLSAKCLCIKRNAAITGNLCVGGNACVNGNLTVNGTIINPNVVTTSCQPGPLVIGTNNATSLTLATNTCTNRVNIDPNGAVTISMPSAGEALTVNGNVVV